MNRGGKRPGAGRPASQNKKQVVSVTLSTEAINNLDRIKKQQNSNRSAVVESLLVAESWKKEALRHGGPFVNIDAIEKTRHDSFDNLIHSPDFQAFLRGEGKE